MLPEQDAHFHWAEGMKYVAEGLKALFLLNGVATVSVLTFIGNENSGDSRLVYSMLFFALGALLSIMSFFSAYIAQLGYGNDDRNLAGNWHDRTYVLIFVSMLSFLVGVCLAGYAFLSFGFGANTLPN